LIENLQENENSTSSDVKTHSLLTRAEKTEMISQYVQNQLRKKEKKM
jgi:hypothetical protein